MVKDFDPNESLENLGILYVFWDFQTAQLGRKIRQPPQVIDSAFPMPIFTRRRCVHIYG